MSLVIGTTLEPYGVWFAAGCGSQGRVVPRPPGPGHCRLHVAGAGARASLDRRSDIFILVRFSTGMLPGKRAFKGGSSVETIDAILKEDRLELTDGEVHVTLGLQRVMRRCLEKPLIG